MDSKDDSIVEEGSRGNSVITCVWNLTCGKLPQNNRKTPHVSRTLVHCGRAVPAEKSALVS